MSDGIFNGSTPPDDEFAALLASMDRFIAGQQQIIELLTTILGRQRESAGTKQALSGVQDSILQPPGAPAG